MKIAYDFHIHTALSPCGDEDMTPNNIVNMSILKGLNVIAITDHNTCRNALSCMQCAEGTDLLVLPGMEVETSEECHVVCIFETIEQAIKMEEEVSSHLPKIKNRTDIFGHQMIMDKEDNVIGEEENLLVTATSLSVSQVSHLASSLGGASFPAHIDKTSYSVISNLGFIDDSYGFKTVEIKNPERVKELYEKHHLSRFKIIHNSDAHYLQDISECLYFLDTPHLTAKQIIDIIRG